MKTESWYGNECEESYVLEEVEICAGLGLSLALVAWACNLISAVIFISAISTVSKQSYRFLDTDEMNPKIEETPPSAENV